MVSLHRSEGLGLHLMEAMSLGKPVVATGWSGNMDFMSTESSIAVGYRLVPVRSEHPGYATEIGREGQVWADADVDEAARALRTLHEDHSRRLAMGAAAAREMEARRRGMLSGGAFDALETVLLPGAAADPRRFARAVRDERARLRWATLRRRARYVARMVLGRSR
jgi:glycosyltransferase involved in cell wall biosynthesis